jgi:hypothetical protein
MTKNFLPCGYIKIYFSQTEDQQLGEPPDQFAQQIPGSLGPAIFCLSSLGICAVFCTDAKQGLRPRPGAAPGQRQQPHPRERPAHLPARRILVDGPPNRFQFASVSRTPSVVPSSDTSRRPRQNAPGVPGPSTRAGFSNSSRKGAGPGRARALESAPSDGTTTPTPRPAQPSTPPACASPCPRPCQ